MTTIIGGVNKGSAYMTTDNMNCMYVNLTAGTTVFTTPVTLYGVNINSHSSGTLKIWDSATPTGTVVINTNTFAAAERTINLFGITTGTACTIVIAGTADVTLAYRKTKEYDLSNNIA